MNNINFAKHLIAAVLASAVLAPAAQAAKLDLSTYKVELAKSLGGVFTNIEHTAVTEASGVTYNWDRNSLMVVGDEGAIGEFNLNGDFYDPLVQSVSAKNGPGGGKYFSDSEGVTYVGGGKYIFADERVANLVTLSSINDAVTEHIPTGATRQYYNAPDPAFTHNVSGGVNWGNSGLEGVSYDPITGGFFAVKQGGPQRVMFIDWDFNTPNSGGTTTDMFNPASLGLSAISDIAVLSTVDAFNGTDFRGNLLILSEGDEKLIEVDRNTGEVLSSFDLSNIYNTTLFIDHYLKISTIEGVTLDKDGNIYLVAELGGINSGASAFIKLAREQVSGAVPEPATWAMMLGGLGLVGGAMRRRATKVAFA